MCDVSVKKGLGMQRDTTLFRHYKTSLGVARAVEEEVLGGLPRSGWAGSAAIGISEAHTMEVGREVAISCPHLHYRRADDAIIKEEIVGFLLPALYVRVSFQVRRY
jgi:hypothetical protein